MISSFDLISVSLILSDVEHFSYVYWSVLWRNDIEAFYRCESWTIKKAEHWRIDAFELWCWRKLLRVPWTATGSSQSILKEISPNYSLEGLMLKLKLKLKLKYFWPPDAKNWLIWKDRDAGKDWRQEEKGRTEDEMVGWLESSKLQELVMDREAWLCCSPWGCKELDTTEWLNWTEWTESKEAT